MLLSIDTALDEEDFQRIRKVVYDYCGISLSDEKRSLVRARLAKLLRANGHDSARTYLDHVEANRGTQAFADFIDAISTNLTSFFRESDHFDYVKDVALPALFDRRRNGKDGRILAWSAACSSGEEPYTLGMTLLERLSSESQAGRWEPLILATDISTRVLNIAKAGTYNGERINGVPAGHRAKYFTTVKSGQGEEAYRVGPALKNIVRFRHLNLMEPWPFAGPFDFIFCRNVMIYFDKPTQEKLVHRYFQCLRPGGLLFTGHSESLTGIHHAFNNRKPSIYEKPE